MSIKLTTDPRRKRKSLREASICIVSDCDLDVRGGGEGCDDGEEEGEDFVGGGFHGGWMDGRWNIVI